MWLKLSVAAVPESSSLIDPLHKNACAYAGWASGCLGFGPSDGSSSTELPPSLNSKANDSHDDMTMMTKMMDDSPLLNPFKHMLRLTY